MIAYTASRMLAFLMSPLCSGNHKLAAVCIVLYVVRSYIDIDEDMRMAQCIWNFF